jgi:hypothetical protein
MHAQGGIRRDHSASANDDPEIGGNKCSRRVIRNETTDSDEDQGNAKGDSELGQENSCKNSSRSLGEQEASAKSDRWINPLGGLLKRNTNRHESNESARRKIKIWVKRGSLIAQEFPRSQKAKMLKISGSYS